MSLTLGNMTDMVLSPTLAQRALATVSTLVLLAGLASCSSGSNQPTLGPQGAVSCAYPVSDGERPARPVDPPRTSEISGTGTTTATMKLATGSVVITLDRSKAPCAVNNFESLVSQKYYDNTQCHRLVDTGIFILQCGDPTATGTGGPGYTFDDELTGQEKYGPGVVAMANRGPNTNGSQFFFVWDQSQLDPDYTIFGTVDAESLNVIKQIASQGVDATDGVSPIADATVTSVVMG